MGGNNALLPIIVSIVLAFASPFLLSLELSDYHYNFLFQRAEIVNTSDVPSITGLSSITNTVSNICHEQLSNALANERNTCNVIKSEDVDAFLRDGSIYLKGVIDENWIRVMRSLLVEVYHAPTRWDIFYSRLLANFYSAQKSILLHHTSKCGQEFLRISPLTQLVNDIAGGNKTLRICEPTEALINYNLIAKQKGKQQVNLASPKEERYLHGHTSWHRDDIYMPVQGSGTSDSSNGSSSDDIDKNMPIVRLWIPLVNMSSFHFKFATLNNSREAKRKRFEANILDPIKAEFARDESLFEDKNFNSWIIDPGMYEPGDVFFFKGDTPHFAQNKNCDLRDGCSRMIFSFCIDENARYDAKKRTGLLPFKSGNVHGAPLSSKGGFNQAHPWNSTDWDIVWKPTYGDIFSSINDAIVTGSGSFSGLNIKKALKYFIRVMNSTWRNIWVKPILNLESGEVINKDCLEIG